MKLKIALVCLCLLLVSSTAFAAEFLAPNKNIDANISTKTEEAHLNLYVAGATVTINNQTQGDLFAAGGVITVNGDVQGDLFAAGGNLNLNGQVAGDLRAGGGNISVNSPVGSDLLIGGGNVTITEKATIAGDLVVGAGNLVVDSIVQGRARIGGGNVVINGKINGDVFVNASEMLTFGPNSEVTGKIFYKGVREAVIKDGAKVGAIEFTKIQRRYGAGKLAGLFTIAILIKLIAIFIAAWLINHLFPGKMMTILHKLYNEPWASLGIGLLFLIVTPIAVLLLMITMIGFYLGLILLALYFLTLLFGAISSPYYVGSMIMLWYKKTEMQTTWQVLLLGVVVMAILFFIPIVGCIILGLIFAANVGALAVKLRPTRTRVVSE